MKLLRSFRDGREKKSKATRGKNVALLFCLTLSISIKIYDQKYLKQVARAAALL